MPWRVLANLVRRDGENLREVVRVWHWRECAHVCASGIPPGEPAGEIAKRGERKTHDLPQNFPAIAGFNRIAQHRHMRAKMRPEEALAQNVFPLERGPRQSPVTRLPGGTENASLSFDKFNNVLLCHRILPFCLHLRIVLCTL